MSKILKCIVVDDEPPAIRIVENYISQIPHMELVFATTKPLEALTFIEKEDFDVIILDIQMPNITGIQLSKIIKQDAKIIFTTAYAEFAVESYDLNAVDYLLKPFEFERFYTAIKKIDTTKMHEHSVVNDYIFVKTNSKNNYEKILIRDIIYIQGLKNYVAIHLGDKKQIITYNTLKAIKHSLPTHLFSQIHKSYLVSMVNIKSTNSSVVRVKGGIELPIGDSYKASFFEQVAKNKL